MSIGLPTFTPTVQRDSSGACPWPQSSTYILSTAFPLDCAQLVPLSKTAARTATMTLTFFMTRPPSGFGRTDFSLSSFEFGLRLFISARAISCLLLKKTKQKPNRLRPVLLVRPAGTIRIAPIAIAGHMFRQTFSGNFNPHSRRIANRPAVFAVCRGLVATPDQVGSHRRLVVILNRRREVRDVRLVLGMLAL